MALDLASVERPHVLQHPRSVARLDLAQQVCVDTVQQHVELPVTIPIDN